MTFRESLFLMTLFTPILFGPKDAAARQETPLENSLAADQLIKRHQLLSHQLAELENKLLRLSQFEMNRNEDRAKLLLKGLKLSQTQELVSDIRATLKLVRKGSSSDLATAIKNQKKILGGLKQLYDLLESNDVLKSQRNKAEKVREKINVIAQLLQRQSLLRQRLGNESEQTLEDEQGEIRSETEKLQNELDGEQQTPDSTAAGSQKPDNEPQDADSMPEVDNKSAESRVAGDLQKAQQEMKAVEKQLRAQDAENVAKSMENASKELSKAKQKLQDILRQNREEEIESTLRTLEERFNQLLQMQLKINEKTHDLSVSKNKTAETRIQAFKLAGEQRKVILEIEKALLILNEEGSSTAIPGTLFQAKLDLIEIVENLELAKIDDELIELQVEVASVFSELVRSVQQEQKEQNDLKKNQSPPPSDKKESMDNQVQRPLLQKLSELKLIKQLQLQINKRHKAYADSYAETTDAAKRMELGRKTRQLAERQNLLEGMALDLLEGSSK